eukprot:6476228-Amphidinium_carterae.2
MKNSTESPAPCCLNALSFKLTGNTLFYYSSGCNHCFKAISSKCEVGPRTGPSSARPQSGRRQASGTQQ